jgi:hypothetical protein
MGETPKPLVAVLVVWHDAHTQDGWTNLDSFDQEPCVVHSVGFLAPDAKPGHVVLVQSRSLSDGMVDALLAIPAAMVVSCTAFQ